VYPGNYGTLSLRRLDTLEPTPLPGLGDPLDPFFSPDGQWIGFFNTNSSIQKVAVTGSPATTLVGLGGAGSRGAAWSEDGTIVFATTARVLRPLRKLDGNSHRQGVVSGCNRSNLPSGERAAARPSQSAPQRPWDGRLVSLATPLVAACVLPRCEPRRSRPKFAECRRRVTLAFRFVKRDPECSHRAARRTSCKATTGGVGFQHRPHTRGECDKCFNRNQLTVFVLLAASLHRSRACKIGQL
jgi:hypothetical protein